MAETGEPIGELESVRFFTHDWDGKPAAGAPPGDDVWLNAADLRRAIKAHEEQIFAASSKALGGGSFIPLLRESIKAANKSVRDLLDRVIAAAEQQSKRGEN